VGADPRAQHWRGRRVLVTGHTGFVGGWLTAWLDLLGAEVSGYSLAPPTQPSFFDTTHLAARLARHVVGDVNDRGALARAVAESRPQVVFHLAAQPLVRESYREPAATFMTNVIGTVNVLEACRVVPGIERLVAYTTDKVYRNDQSGRAFAEDERLGGNEPYSASKAGAEMALAAYWDSYFRRDERLPTLSIVRAGNIIGGGDWASERLFPDAMRAFASGAPLVLRQPNATRPWQHVLDAVRATLVLAERDEPRSATAAGIAWNFGPATGEVHPVAGVANEAVAAWGAGASWREERDERIPESRALVLASGKAERELGWRARWQLRRAVAESVAWYRAALAGADMLAFTRGQIEAHAA
jgi:CDP-glucose 4,6-dehydratase